MGKENEGGAGRKEGRREGGSKEKERKREEREKPASRHCFRAVSWLVTGLFPSTEIIVQ